MMRVKGVVGQVVMGVAVLLGVGGCVIIDSGGCHVGFWNQRARFERTVELQHPMAAGGTLAVSTASGSIETTGQETDQVQVVARITARAATEEEAQELAEQVVIGFRESGDRLEIKADRPSSLSRRSISISYTIVAPRQIGLDCESASGSVKVRDLTGNVNAGAASGSVGAAGIQGAVRLHSASGSIRCENVGGGDLDLSTASGSVRLADATQVGTCRAHSSSGSVRLRHVQADSIRADSASGSVTADDIACVKLSASSGSGHVSAVFSPSAPNNVVADLGAASGGVDVTLPPGFAGRVDLSTGSGSVRVDLPVTVKGEIGRRHVVGTIGEGDGSLTAHTGSGSIHVR